MRKAWVIALLLAVCGCRTTHQPDLVVVVEYQPFKDELKDHPVRVRAEYRPFGHADKKAQQKRVTNRDE